MLSKPYKVSKKQEAQASHSSYHRCSETHHQPLEEEKSLWATQRLNRIWKFALVLTRISAHRNLTYQLHKAFFVSSFSSCGWRDPLHIPVFLSSLIPHTLEASVEPPQNDGLQRWLPGVLLVVLLKPFLRGGWHERTAGLRLAAKQILGNHLDCLALRASKEPASAYHALGLSLVGVLLHGRRSLSCHAGMRTHIAPTLMIPYVILHDISAYAASRKCNTLESSASAWTSPLCYSCATPRTRPQSSRASPTLASRPLPPAPVSDPASPSPPVRPPPPHPPQTPPSSSRSGT